MKKYSALIAAFLFSCASEIESPDSILQKISSSSEMEISSSSNEMSSSSDVSSSSEMSSSGAVSSSSKMSSSSTVSSSSARSGYHVLRNESFEDGALAPWEAKFGALSSSSQGKIEWKENIIDGTSYGYDVIFTPSKKETKNWELQLRQDGLNIKSGYSYTLKVGGNTTKGGTAPVVFALIKCLNEPSNCTDHKNWSVKLSSDYKDDFIFEEWKNCSETNSNASFVISGGLSEVEFKIAWVSIWAEPVSCP